MAAARQSSVGVYVGLAGVLAAAVLVFHVVEAGASEPGRAAQSLPDGSVARPHLEAPAIPEPRQIHVPDAATSQLLLATQEVHVPAGIRLMVFAPHPDDETLGAAGLIQRVLTRQGNVRVVFVTNGDGYVDGVRLEMRRARTSTADFIEYGRLRHDEALRALHDLGLGTDDALFLGFPDDGIDDLWAGHWSDRHPYISPYTRFDRPPYKDSLRRRVEYAGADLESEITRALREFTPDWVVTPDPRDRHPDHCTTGVFVLDALRKLRHDGTAPFRRTQVLSYLVHSPDYPASPQWVKEVAGAGVGGSPTAGRVLSAAPWLQAPLTAAELAGKRAAIAEYRSQVQVMNPFLKQFMRSFELFSQLDAAQVVTVPTEYAARFGRPK